MKIALVAAEMAPFAKVGGLADVIGALPAELAACGAQVSVLMPGYASALRSVATEPMGDGLSVMLGERTEHFTLRSGIGPAGVPLFFIMHEGFFGRPEIYGEQGRDYPDNFRRFVFFARAALQVLASLTPPDLIHAHDWHAAAVPLLMRAHPELRARFASCASVFTIHNLAFQGQFDRSDFVLLNLDPAYMATEYLEFYGRGNLLKAAVVTADAVTTVSPTYAREVREPGLGFGLEGVLRAKGEHFVGILNGADYNEWNPASDRFLAATYSANDMTGKDVCAQQLCRQLDLAHIPGRPLIGMVSRLSSQKGFDLLLAVLDKLLAKDTALVILGRGESEIEQRLEQAVARYGDRLRVRMDYDNPLAHRIQAGCDLFLMPSRFEPCGLTQMYALKYGTIPVVRATGGLADTVTQFDPVARQGTGFRFQAYEGEALLEAVGCALDSFADRGAWEALRQNAMAADFSWSHAARAYLSLFERARTWRITR
ncbi:MAG TPA: glycogen synthase GlgA [Candidatus Binataceae bacterium]|nr:glycogen synthase GlgA [Candidatus Binataceae bacterium]